MKTLLQVVTGSLALSLESKGFKKRADGIFTKELADGFIGWLGLNHAKHKQGIEINPVVGIRCQELERVLATILQEKPHKYIPPTVSISLGYLMPKHSYRAWIFEGDIGDSALSDLTDAIYCYGIPFMESNSVISKIDALLESPKFGHFDQVMYRRPLARWLLGDFKGALQICDGYCRELGQRADMAAAQFRQFSRGVESLVKQVRA